MKRIDIKITYKCNNRCIFCVQGDAKRSCKDRSTSQISAILEQSRRECEEVVFTGGDPAIRPDLLELVSCAKKLKYFIQIQTNGRMFAYKGFCADIIGAGADIFGISVHGHTPQLHDRLTRAPGSFAQTMAGIRNLLSFNRPVMTNTVINKYNYRFLPLIAAHLISSGVVQYQFAFPHIVGCAFKNRKSVIARKTEVISYLRQGLDIGVKSKVSPKTEAIPYCFLRGYERCISENDIPETRVIGTQVTESFNSWRKDKGKAKGPACAHCKCFNQCEGPWREYPEIFGWEEFIPIR